MSSEALAPDRTTARQFYHGTRADLKPGDLDAAIWGAELADGEWQGYSPERLKQMKEHLERLKAQGIEAID